ncbi:hypothetical protein HYU09_00970 [Candidatus Woesearchaeota archaeon]|nr:hypothetical protein [Candidatus Woesearchaeota archaeon]
MGLPDSFGTYGIYSDHYTGKPSKENPANFITVFGNKASKGPWAPSFSWNNTSAAQTFEALMAHTIHYYSVANDNSKLRVATCYRTTEVDKKDLAALGHIYSWEDKANYFVPWTAGNPILTTGHKPQTHGIMTLGPEITPEYSRFSTMTDVNVPIKLMTMYGNIANNDFGKMTSQAATAEHSFRKYLFSERLNYVPGLGYVPFTDRAMEWRDALLSEGFDQDRQLKGIGAGDLDRMHAHAVTIYRKHIALSNKLVSEAWKLAHAHGYKGISAQKFVDTYIANVIEHETAHLYEEEGVSEKDSESGIRMMHGRVNAKRAASREGTSQGKIYDVLSRHWYASAEEFQEGRARGMSKLESIALEAAKEAEDMGLEGEEAVAYVSDKVNEYDKNKESEESDSGESRLEEAIEESADGEPNPDGAGNNYESNKAEASETADDQGPANDNAQESQAA